MIYPSRSPATGVQTADAKMRMSQTQGSSNQNNSVKLILSVLFTLLVAWTLYLANLLIRIPDLPADPFSEHSK